MQLRVPEWQAHRVRSAEFVLQAWRPAAAHKFLEELMIQVGLQQICKARSAMSAGRAGHWRFMRSMRSYLGGMAGPGRRSGQRPGRNGAFKHLASGPGGKR